MTNPITVKRIKRVKLQRATPVYDITVPVFRNFALANGVVVHNTAVHARNPEYQEILALSGKIPNVYKNDDEKTLLNDRIIDILKSIGYNPKNPDDRRVGKVIILADADSDGAHIEALVLTMLLRFSPSLFKQGRVYRVEAALYTYDTGKTKVLANSLNELRSKIKGQFDPNKVTRLKGWGECEPELLRTLAFDKKTRKLSRITLEEAKEQRRQVQRVVALMGEGADARRELLGIE